MGTLPAAWMLVTVLWIAEPGQSKVYYVCGAVLDSTERGLILSPGFPKNYLPGSHCVWQFFVPAGSLLVVETLDFDVFESPSDNDPPARSSSSDFVSLGAHKRAGDDALYTEVSSIGDPQRANLLPTTEQAVYPNEVNDEIVSRDSWDKTDKRELLEFQVTKEQSLLNQGANTSQKGAVVLVAKSFDGVRGEPNKPLDFLAPFTARVTEHIDAYWQQESKIATLSSIALGIDPSTTQPPALDVCPHDVLYISDLVTFSSRFCGANSPMNKSLVFGSPVEMIEVIMELITTTDRGRGFAMLFAYQNHTRVTAMGVQGRQSGESVTLLAVTTATISFALVLLLVLCLSYRQKMCPKRDQEPSQVTQQENGSQNAALEINELQLVVPGEDLQNRELESVSREEEAAEPSRLMQEEPSSSSAVGTDSHSDEVFIISAGSNTEHFTFTSYTPQERNLKRSVTSPASVSDWLNSEYTSVDLGSEDRGNENVEVDPARQRTWSARTFNRFLPPIPQFQMKWRSRTSSGSFTKLVDSGCTAAPGNTGPQNPRKAGSAVQMDGSFSRLYSESSVSNASYPLTQSAQQQRKLPSCNLKKSRFASPYFGFLNGSPDCFSSGAARGTCPRENHNLCQKSASEFTSSAKSITANGVRAKEHPVDLEKSKPVFVICEEADDQQPLVLDDQLSPNRDGFSVENEARSIRCKVDVHSVEGYRYPYTEDMPSMGSAGNLGNPCATDISRQETAMDANPPFPQVGFDMGRPYLEQPQPV
ncbi:hypothetical protein FKM82_005166 [Ascaphus truei]